jgi:hypothetical protein
MGLEATNDKTLKFIHINDLTAYANR